MIGWKSAKLGEICTIVGGGTPTRNNPAFYGGDIPWVTPKDMKAWEISDAQIHISERGLESSATRLVPANTILVVVRSGVLKHTIPIGINRCPVAINQDMKGLICSDRVYPDFLARFLKEQSHVILQWVRATTADNFPVDKLKELDVPLPPLSEQRRIADILDKADALRTKRRVALAQLETLGQSIFLDMFGDPATNPKGWPIRPFGELGNNEDSQRVPVKGSDREERRGSYPYYGASGIIDWIDEYIFEGERLLIGEDGANLIARATPVAYLARGKYWVNNHAHVIAPNGSTELRFLEFFIEHLDLTPYLSGTAQPKLNQSNLDRIAVPVPPLDRQKRFGQFLSALDRMRDEQERSACDLDGLFASLQHRAFRGELTSSEASEAA